jgi:ribonuclease T1
MVTRRRPQPLIFLAAALALFITALWQQRANSHQRAESQASAPAQPRVESQPRVERVPPIETQPRVEPQESAESPMLAVPAKERAQVEETLRLIERGGPFPYEKDGTVFSNREGRLPAHPRGYYREYTVPTPGARNRGARRIVRGKGGETYYTRDHYETFTRIDTQ